ncbi:phosphatidate phosphatase APP1 [Neolewinella xylanilytica]|uniref:Phosphatidate phosphatase APP1 n=1 Tax=Neolewinella xylanilytica TaxID=1514080 RepID=A0A2S6IBC2_9BACT|nr:phosphatase domain-containing protein [Neolewinella xylanilytica]PPK88813.1 phosphatidate phosphatase APP1 [Neolewinella xylanilytica]
MPVTNLAKEVHREWDNLVDRLRWGHDKPVDVANYIGFARPDYLYLTGRVLRDKGVSRNERDRLWHNLVNNFKRFNSREIDGAEVEISWGEHTFHRTTDSEGYFQIEHHCDPSEAPSLDDALWQEATVRVVSTPLNGEVNHISHSDVIMPIEAEYGVISDIDDTILKTDVTSRLKLKTLMHTFLKNASNRRAFEGVSAFYQALQLGPDGKGYNPFFYVSNSPWNLYDLLLDFLHLNHLPRGPILLRDFGLPAEDTVQSFKTHKADMVDKILSTYPDLQFILLGDSGEHDTDIYLEAARNNPDRILCIYIRDVKHEERAQRIESMIEDISLINVKLVGSYEHAAAHAREKGWII